MNVDFNWDDLKKLSPGKKALIVFCFCLLLGFLYYIYFLQGIISSQVSLRTKLADRESQIAAKEKVAAQIGRYKKEVERLTVDFNTALLKLPNQREIAGLLASVVLSGKEAGVSFLLFEPKPPAPAVPAATAAPPAKPDKKGAKSKPEEPLPFYDEIPITVKLSGTFHNTVTFLAKAATLSRIVNVEDMTIGEAKPEKDGKIKVITSCTMKTYKFVDRGKQ
jgi:type IV pilus assembly protein PilO